MNSFYQTIVSKNDEREKSNRSLIILFSSFLLFDALLGFLVNTDILSVAIWILLCFSLFLFRLKFFIKFGVFIFYNTTNILGVYIIENSSIFLEELGIYSYRANSLFLITLTHCIFFFFLLLVDTKVERRMNKHNQFTRFRIGSQNIDNSIIVLLGCIFIICAAFILSKVIINPASKQRMDRFIYQKTYIKGIWNVFHTYLIYLIPILVILLYKRKTLLTVIALLLFCIYMYLVGHKFGVFLTVLIFFIPYLIDRFKLDKISFKNMNRVFIIGIIVIFIFLIILYSFMNKTYGSDKQQFVQYLFDRLAQQGQMWWAVFDKEKGAGVHFDELAISSGALFGINKSVIDDYNFGIFKLMKLVTPYQIYYTKISSNSRYAFSTQASLFYYFKSFGLIGLSCLLAVFISYMVNWYWREVKQYSWFGSIISGFFYVLILAVYTQSDFNVLFSKPKALIIFLYLIIRKISLIYASRNRVNRYKI